VHVANATDARKMLADVVSCGDVPALVSALTVVLDANDRNADPAVVDRFGLSRDYLRGFDAGVQYAADLAVASLRSRPPSS
jgi:hypothetical protein